MFTKASNEQINAPVEVLISANSDTVALRRVRA